ncbi:prolyl oligopeptidase family serine peptidase, partial [Staphylococcus epidermidis]|uniref:alpha/beta hydrolase family protein n=1 Tax=Staphylococcus epidermidis TaxID=1282 RepID=UPI0030BA4196
LLAALFAGQGYVVISPNYAGYDKSSLAYHPYLNAQQQSHEMADALKAGREVVRRTGSATNVADNGKLFVTGYSQGGYVAMATTRYLETLKEPVT